MITTIAIVVAVILAAVFAYAASKPDTFMVRRTTLVAARPEQIFFPLIDDLRAQSTWLPFEKDRDMKRTYSGAPRGKGAVYEWDGNRQVGAGRIAIIDSVPPAKVTLLLSMDRPFEAENTVEFTLDRDVAGTSVTWAMSGRQPFMGKLMGIVMNCDKMIGGEFERGLANLKRFVEEQPAVVAAE